MPEDDKNLIQLYGVNRTFKLGGSEVHALHDITLHIQCGEYISIMGPSGSGKSTLLNLIGLLDRADSGNYIFEDRDITSIKADEQAQIRSKRIGFIFQNFNLLARLTAAENIELPLILANIPAYQRKALVIEALREYGLTDRAQHHPNELSGGQRQRVAIARATILRPAILLADEPTGNLDRLSGKELIQTLEALNHDGMTLILVTHDLELAAHAHRKIRMVDGAIVEDVTNKKT